MTYSGAMSTASNSPATLPTVQIGRQSYAVKGPTPGVVTYELTGPRGGQIVGIRNVNSGRIYLMRGAKTLPYIGSDASGTLTVVAT